ncbi:hypothetical protein ESCO_005796 [Escovopsis weberi]|uniref:Uncharacterized protein n=1 Tax=Escovopsis weberi TaxID=150374 RepID=A0A0M8N3N1_ESCWE|nr:hypothetical protein ESCO_005796 [Escovopsis weberi]
MNVDVPELIKSMVPGDSEGRTARIISDRNVNYRDHHFLASDFPRAAPKIYLTAEDDDFDPETLADWRNEGFDVEYFPMGNDTEAYNRALRDLSKVERGPCETFGIVATLCLEHYHIWDNNPGFQLAFLIAYYPSSIPHPEGRFPSSLNVLVHLIAGEPINITQRSQMHGMKGKLTVSRGTVDSGIGTGGLLNMAYSSYAYHAKAGFSEHDLEEYDRVAADLAWSRSLASARQAFNRHENLELAVEHSLRGKFWSRNLTATMDSFTTRENPHVTYLPTLTGGIGEDELEKFYADFFAYA